MKTEAEKCLIITGTMTMTLFLFWLFLTQVIGFKANAFSDLLQTLVSVCFGMTLFFFVKTHNPFSNILNQNDQNKSGGC